ncbi:MAG: cobyrinic acid a c-diamide synthase [Nitrospirae bacterium]|nr:MAG: cobyrinic acid a c-diamide synthase [Nitrospirota bacterium]
MAQGIVIAGTHSGGGKTTITLGLLAALKKKGLKVQSFKAGPDFIDSGLHRIITGRPSRNLDIRMCGEDYVRDCFYKHSMDADISIVEGVMGMYDGEFSTANLAEQLNLPVILVVDAYGMAESAGAVVRGFASYEGQRAKGSKGQSSKNPDACLAGVIFNRVASESHYLRLKESVRDVAVMGYLPRDLDFEIPHRHLGLTVAEENPIAEENIERLAKTVWEHVDVDAILSSIPHFNSPLSKGGHRGVDLSSSSTRIAIAYDKAFCFYYEDNFDLLKDAGAEIITFSLLSDSEIPDGVDAVYIGGGYPELYTEELSKNKAMLASIKGWADSGRPVYAECGGLMYLSQGIYDFDGNLFKMAGIFPFETQMKRGRPHLGYRDITLKDDCIIGKKGDKLRGHEFHYSEIKPSAISCQLSAITNCYALNNNKGGADIQDEGYRFRNTIASYIHVHFGSNPDIANNFINFTREY